MGGRFSATLIVSAAFLLASVEATTAETFHLHDATVLPGKYLLSPSPPNTPPSVIRSADLKGARRGQRIVTTVFVSDAIGFDGEIYPSTIRFRVWMRKTANVGTITAAATGGLDHPYNGQCFASAATPLTTTFTLQTFTCTQAGDRYWTDTRFELQLTAKVDQNISKTVFVETAVGGVEGGSFDSTVDMPHLLTIKSISPGSGDVGIEVTITGTGFGPAEWSHVVMFNGVAATTTSWTDTNITAVVPVGAATGPVSVFVGYVESSCPNDNCTFDVASLMIPPD